MQFFVNIRYINFFARLVPLLITLFGGQLS
jgi:hypothetical protein